MSKTPPETQRDLLLRVARRAMREHGLEPDFSPEALAEAERVPNAPGGVDGKDLRDLPWCSIDNDDSRDLDQLTVAASRADGTSILYVAVANVIEAVPSGSALDGHARTNTTSVYTPPRVFPMLPERLSTDLTSLGPDQDRAAMVIEIHVDAKGQIGDSGVSRALVRNRAKLAYSGVGPWLEGSGPIPSAIGAVPGLEANLRLQDGAAQRLRSLRHEHGALVLQSIEVRPQLDDGRVSALPTERPNRAKELIEDLMIAANETIARFLESRRFPVLRRVVRTPKRWARIVEIAKDLGEPLPDQPDPVALNRFLEKRRAADPVRFPDLSLSVIKLLGRGEYVASFPGEEITGHFGLAVSDYTHSTAPNRRYPDVITQRLLRAALEGSTLPYGRDELIGLADHCTQREDDVNKIERLLDKAAAACLLSSRIGEEFDGIVTGASEKGTWVRVFDPHVEGRVEQGQEGLDVGDRVRVRLVHTDPERGFIDFARTGHAPVGRPRG
ncbi:MAG TPA: RNB domain-containing ribonuclease [Candidatus Omnitrophota bacterium]|nr:RNB domain-containing ribonuclease [Candidatus Omnitrophota bacterium]